MINVSLVVICSNYNGRVILLAPHINLELSFVFSAERMK